MPGMPDLKTMFGGSEPPAQMLAARRSMPKKKKKEEHKIVKKLNTIYSETDTASVSGMTEMSENDNFRNDAITRQFGEHHSPWQYLTPFHTSDIVSDEPFFKTDSDVACLADYWETARPKLRHRRRSGKFFISGIIAYPRI